MPEQLMGPNQSLVETTTASGSTALLTYNLSSTPDSGSTMIHDGSIWIKTDPVPVSGVSTFITLGSVNVTNVTKCDTDSVLGSAYGLGTFTTDAPVAAFSYAYSGDGLLIQMVRWIGTGSLTKDLTYTGSDWISTMGSWY